MENVEKRKQSIFGDDRDLELLINLMKEKEDSRNVFNGGAYRPINIPEGSKFVSDWGQLGFNPKAEIPNTLRSYTRSNSF